MAMRIGYALFAADNKRYMYSDNSGLSHCDGCGYRFDYFAHNDTFVLTPQFDASATYDGQNIVSKRFARYCKNNKFDENEFLSFSNDREHFHWIIHKIIKVNQTINPPTLDNLCAQCKRYESTAGASPLFLQEESIPRIGCFRTDIEFSCGNSKHPIFIAGIQTRDDFKSNGFTGIYFKPVYSMSTTLEDAIRDYRLFKTTE